MAYSTSLDDTEQTLPMRLFRPDSPDPAHPVQTDPLKSPMRSTESEPMLRSTEPMHCHHGAAHVSINLAGFFVQTRTLSVRFRVDDRIAYGDILDDFGTRRRHGARCLHCCARWPWRRLVHLKPAVDRSAGPLPLRTGRERAPELRNRRPVSSGRRPTRFEAVAEAGRGPKRPRPRPRFSALRNGDVSPCRCSFLGASGCFEVKLHPASAVLSLEEGSAKKLLHLASDGLVASLRRLALTQL